MIQKLNECIVAVNDVRQMSAVQKDDLYFLPLGDGFNDSAGETGHRNEYAARLEDWVYGNCVIYDGDRPRLNPDGALEMRLMVFPSNACRVYDTWRVGGLRGTGSNDFSLEELFVPADRSVTAFSGKPSQPILYKFPFSLVSVRGIDPNGRGNC